MTWAFAIPGIPLTIIGAMMIYIFLGIPLLETSVRTNLDLIIEPVPTLVSMAMFGLGVWFLVLAHG